MKASAILRVFCFAVVFLFVRQSAFAQGAATGDLHVIVKDPKGNVVTNATVTVRDVTKGLERAGTSDGQGGYSVRQLAPATYSVTVDAPGFGKAEATQVAITVGDMAELPITLAVAGGKEVIEVNAQADIVETSRSSTTDTIGERSIDNLPINGRNYIQFTLTDSQVQRDSAPNTGAAPTSGLNMSGQRARSNLVNVDGADAIDNSTNGVRSTVSQEDVQEFQIITNSYAAEYGRASGGVVNIITRSGSNNFHGDVYGYLRDRDFQAVNPFSTTPNPAYTRVQAGTAFGGPIKKDKTYYFFSYEITRRHETGFSSIGVNNFGQQSFDATSIFDPLLPPGTFTIPVASQAQVAFLTPFEQAGPAPQAIQFYTWLLGGSSWLATKGTQGAFASLPFAPPGSGPQQFPTSCNLAVAIPICAGLPTSFQSVGSQEGNFPVFEGTSLYSLRLDHNVSNNNRLSVWAHVSPSTVTGIEVSGQDQPFGQNAYSRTSQQTYRDVAGMVQDTWTLGTNKVNEFQFQYARRGLSYYYNTAIPGGSDPAVNIPGFAYFGREPYSYIQRIENRYQFRDNFSWTKGRHDIKFGVDFNYIPITATFTVNYGGVYDFGAFNVTPFGLPSSFPQLSALQAYGAGLPGDFIQGLGSPTDSFSNKPLGLFFQDSWRVRPNLTLNLGVRYDVEFPPQLKPLQGLALAAYNTLGLQKGIQTDWNNIQPRVGVAWDPKGDGKTVVRASFGMFYDHPLLGLYFLGDASDGSTSGQLAFGGTGLCAGAGNPANLNAIPIFQGLLPAAGGNVGSPCSPTNNPAVLSALNYLPNQQQFTAQNFPQSEFLNQNYLNPSTFLPLGFQPFGYPQGKNFVYAYSEQTNLTIERDLGGGYAFSLAYNFNGGRHLNRPINANTIRGDLMVRNLNAAVAAGMAQPTDSPFTVSACGVGSGGPFVPAALTNFFRPSALNPSVAIGLSSQPSTAACVTTVLPLVLQEYGLSTSCNLTTLVGCIPFGDMDANYSNGSSVYHGLTANLRKRFSNHYQFLASYTWSHAIDDSTDLESTLTPQDSYYPNADRSSSLFDQRQRFVFSGVYQSGKLSGTSFASKFFSNWTLASTIEFSSGRPFNIITGNDDNYQLSSLTGRANTFVNPACTAIGNAPVNSKYSPTGVFQEPCVFSFTGTLASLDGNQGRNAGITPWVVFNDVRFAKRVNFGERFSMDFITDMFNIANVYNVAAVSPLFTNAGQATAAYDPRQFQFALKVNW
ncbi:MAG: TonB-dependent receptor [Terriglobales bacterium]